MQLRGVILDSLDLDQMRHLSLKIVNGEVDTKAYEALLDDRAEMLDHLTDGTYCEGHEDGQDLWAVPESLEATLIKVFPELLIHDIDDSEWSWDYHWDRILPE